MFINKRPQNQGSQQEVTKHQVPEDYVPQYKSTQYLEDLATVYWFSEALFTAVEMNIFTLIEPGGKTAGELASALEVDRPAMERFLPVLCALGLLEYEPAVGGNVYSNTELSRTRLIRGSEGYQGDSILWRKELATSWRSLRESLRAGGRVNFPPEGEGLELLAARTRRYFRAMDCVAEEKAREILPFFRELPLHGEILDVGSGSGIITRSFLKHFPAMKATLMDLPGVLELARETITQKDRDLSERVSCCPANILEPWPLEPSRFALIILSNVLHAYGEKEAFALLENAAKFLQDDGFILVHDFFLEHFPAKAALFDMNMLVHTYNGKVFAGQWVRDTLSSLGLYATALVPLPSDTALVIAAKSRDNLASLALAIP